MKLLKCTVSYIGNRYDGWQSQKSGNGIQDILEAAISRIENRKVSITGSGRTDAGVSARAQVFMFETDRDMSSFRWMGAINAFLPDDIHIHLQPHRYLSDGQSLMEIQRNRQSRPHV